MKPHEQGCTTPVHGTVHCFKQSPIAVPEVSVLVRVRDEIEALPEFWRRIQFQTIAAKTEVLFLDSGSTDGTMEFLQTLPCGLYQLEGEFNFGRSCNQIASLATAPVLMFLSGHVFLEDALALERILDLLVKNPDAAAYLRQVQNPAIGFSLYEAAYLAHRFPAGDQTIQLDSPGAFSNAASAILRASWLRHPFKEMHGSEDFEWAKEHLASGGSMFYLPQVLAQHSHNESAGKVYERVRMNALARGESGSYGKAAYMLAGVYLSMLRAGASHAEAWQYASAHARAYL
jgi:glycosyltransferase involved in cell wall biosynthesis